MTRHIWLAAFLLVVRSRRERCGHLIQVYGTLLLEQVAPGNHTLSLFHTFDEVSLAFAPQ